MDITPFHQYHTISPLSHHFTDITPFHQYHTISPLSYVYVFVFVVGMGVIYGQLGLSHINYSLVYHIHIININLISSHFIQYI